MSNSTIPFNLGLLVLTDDKLRTTRAVSTLDVYAGSSRNFHDDGLFSTLTFGRVGEERRSRRFSYIDIKVPVLHPVIYNTLAALKRLYVEILNGKSYARWDDEVKDFVRADQLDGQTGYTFFLEHWHKIVFEERASSARDTNIKLIQRYRSKALNSKIVVIPAGLRDFEIQADGRESENEINELYRKLLRLSHSVQSSAFRFGMSQYDGVRMRLQLAFNELFALFESYTEGKKKLLMGKWATRGIHNGTRNVITTTNIRANELGSPANVGYNDTVVGLYQYLKATLPVTKHQLKTGFLSQVFQGPNAPAQLVDKKTLKRTPVLLKPKFYDQWMTEEGLDNVISRFGEQTLRQKELEVEGHYMGLIYKAPGVFKIFQDIDELPEGFDRSLVKPITFMELMYLAVYPHSRRYPAMVTRYPVTGFGSIYPSWIFLKPTVQTVVRKPLNDNWEIDESLPTAWQFPTDTESFNSMSPSPARLGLLGADFDGDMCSLNVLYSEEAIAEVTAKLNDKSYYVGPDGRIAASVVVDTVNYMLRNMTGDPVPDEALGLEGYREHRGGTFLHAGHTYLLNPVLKDSERLPTLDFKVKDLEWVLDFSDADEARVESADLSAPVLVHDHPEYGLTVIDGLHRLTRAVKEKKETIPGKLVTDKILDKARLSH